MEGLEGKGDLAARRQLSTKDLADYIKGRVAALAKAVNGEQEPQYFKGRRGGLRAGALVRGTLPGTQPT